MEFCASTAGRVRYAKVPKDHDREANCVSAIRRIFQKIVVRFPECVWVGSLPGRLEGAYNFRSLRVNVSELITGDLIFLRRPTVELKVSHVAMVLGDNVYHCTSSRGGTAVEPLQALLFRRYEQYIQCPRQLLEYRDLREGTVPGEILPF